MVPAGKPALAVSSLTKEALVTGTIVLPREPASAPPPNVCPGSELPPKVVEGPASSPVRSMPAREEPQLDARQVTARTAIARPKIPGSSLLWRIVCPPTRCLRPVDILLIIVLANKGKPPRHGGWRGRPRLARGAGPRISPEPFETDGDQEAHTGRVTAAESRAARRRDDPVAYPRRGERPDDARDRELGRPLAAGVLSLLPQHRRCPRRSRRE